MKCYPAGKIHQNTGTQWSYKDGHGLQQQYSSGLGGLNHDIGTLVPKVCQENSPPAE